MNRGGVALLLLAASTQPVLAAERGYSVTDFERIDVAGPYAVIVETGRSPSARAIGAVDGIDRLSVQTIGRTLRIRPSASAWGGRMSGRAVAPTIRITVPNLRDAFMNGTGSLTISKMRGQTLRISLAGAGQLSVTQVETDRLFASTLGSGTLSLGGKAAVGTLKAEGTSSISAEPFRVDNLDLTSTSGGSVVVTGGKTAKVTAIGIGNVTVGGEPACTVNATGAGEVSCGR